MTREEAIARIELAATELTGTLSATTEPSAAEVLQRYIDAYDMAISALREQEELESNLKVLESNRIEGKDTNVPTNTAQRVSNTSNALGGWIRVEERLPQEFVSVLGYMTDSEPFPSVRECYRVSDNNFCFPALKELHPISHWMPLPEAPKGENMTIKEALSREDRICHNLLSREDKEAVRMVFATLADIIGIGILPEVPK